MRSPAGPKYASPPMAQQIVTKDLKIIDPADPLRQRVLFTVGATTITVPDGDDVVIHGLRVEFTKEPRR